MAQEKKISLDDERLAKVTEKALEGGKARFENQKDVFERINGEGSSLRETTTAPTPKNPSVVIKNLRTFQGDVAEALKSQNASVVTIAMAEQQRAQTADMLQEKPVKKRWGWRKAPEVARITGNTPQRSSLKTSVPLSTPFNQPSPEPSIESKIPAEAVQPQKSPEMPPKVQPSVPSEPSKPIVPQNPPQKPLVQMQSARPPQSRVVFSQPKKERFDHDLVKNTATIALSILLILLGVGAVFGFYMLQKSEPKIAESPPIDQTLIAFNQKETLYSAGLDREAFLREVDTLRRNKPGGENDILYIALPEGESGVSLTTAQFFALLDTEAPGSLVRSFGNQFMLGMVHMGTNQPFLLLHLDSFDNAFDGMLRWEKTLNTDLGALFSTRTIPITEYLPETGIASSTATTSTVAVTRVLNVDAGAETLFEDLTVRNKDARVLKNTRGDILLLYSFLDRETLLITSGPSALQEIMTKTLAEKLIR